MHISSLEDEIFYYLDDMKQSIPKPSSEAAHKRMKAAKPRDTLPELQLQFSLETLGIQFEIDEKPIENLQRRADILLRKERVAIFIDGCFWHGCPIHGTQSKANAEFWADKITRNKERDADTNQRLINNGWTVIRVWEHEDPNLIASKILEIIENMRKNSS